MKRPMLFDAFRGLFDSHLEFLPAATTNMDAMEEQNWKKQLTDAEIGGRGGQASADKHAHAVGATPAVSSLCVLTVPPQPASLNPNRGWVNCCAALAEVDAGQERGACPMHAYGIFFQHIDTLARSFKRA